MSTDSKMELRTLTRFFLERSTAAYKLAATERKHIHAQEWEEDLDFTVLGAVELLDTEIAGIASSLIGPGPLAQSLGETIELLRKSKVISNPKISTWAIQQSPRFPKYLDYLCTLETLRLSLLEIFLDQQS